MKQLTFLAAVMLAGGWLNAQPADATVLYEQPYIQDAQSGWMPASSGNDNLVSNEPSNFRLLTTVDKFSPSVSGTITKVTWRGIYLDWDLSATSGPAPNTNLWSVAIYPDDNGYPDFVGGVAGGVASGNVSSSIVGTMLAGATNVYTVDIYEFVATLSNPGLLALGTDYWIQITSSADYLNPQFLLAPGSGGDGISLLYDSGPLPGTQPAWQSLNTEPGYRLEGDLAAAVPEPGTLLLMALGLIAFAGVQGSRRKLPSTA